MTQLAKKIPTIQDLISGDEITTNELTVILNSEPPPKFIQEHPNIKVKNAQNQYVPLKFIPRENVEYMLTRIYGSLTTFNILFKSQNDHFVGEKTK